ncbi:unnamed protein product [Clonostachys solani]|uniref:Uncharacterized protein n=1 Tax=Clonostachys solani TaxID=160281 RepID=A0A9N9ZFG5_9HYPO|nr:unnamed protein product [Clonostachys solani]
MTYSNGHTNGNTTNGNNNGYGLHKGPRRAPRVTNVLERRYDPQFYQAIFSIMALREKYLRDGYIFVRGEDMIPILKGLGALDEDFEPFGNLGDLTSPDPTVNYRAITSGRYCVDSETRTIQRLESQDYVLTLEEDYKRHDSGIPRMFDDTPPDMQSNTVIHTLMLFKTLVYQGVPITPRDNLNYYTPKWICTLFNIRVTTAPELGIFGEPALEGVHTDGSDHTMTVFLNCSNMHPESGITFMHDNKETTGVQLQDTNPALIRGRVHHQKRLDTLMFVDHDTKHSVTPVHQLDPAHPATRDMLIVFTRKPKLEGHVSGFLDSVKLNATSPFHLPMWLP